ncbi:MAG: HAMP domain-containing histidine kinase [Candidatus Aminicenantes bacterium]|nr:HAMP domain-containing histidine kinase [Candidatus Aminicenantes bacterium]
MLNNLRLVLSQNRKVLTIFFIVVFLPSIFLAFFGMRALRNEKFKFQQQTLEEQKIYVSSLQKDIQDFIEKKSSDLIDLAQSEVFSGAGYSEIRKLIVESQRRDPLLGEVVVWNKEGELWLPVHQALPALAKTVIEPDEWKKIQSNLYAAEMAEFQLKDFSSAISHYRQVLSRSKNDQVRAWILSRIARCEVKQEGKKQALVVYRSLVDSYPDLLTESGRSLEFVSRLEILNIFYASDNYESLFKESLETYVRLEEKAWSLDMRQVKLYADTLKEIINDVVAKELSDVIPEDFLVAVTDYQKKLEKKLHIGRLAEFAVQDVLPNLQVQKSVLMFEGEETLLISIPLNGNNPGFQMDFLGSIFSAGDLTKNADTLLSENTPQGISVLIRSIQTDRIVFGEKNEEAKTPMLTDLFFDNIPPWRVEIFQENSKGFVLYKNIIFWMILTLLLILFFGSGLILRLLAQEMNLLQLKSEFIASVSHEFKTPLTSMGAILEHLQDGKIKDPDKIREYYRILRHDSDRLKRLVLNVLDFTKFEEGKRKYRLELIKIDRLVRKEVDSFEKEHKLSGFTVELRMENVGFSVLADEEALNQAFHNILDNAAKFSQREKKIEVSVERKGDKVEISVSDKGIGIPESEQKKIFEKFYRGKQASSISPTGTGLGLTLVKHIMTAHGGDVVVLSRQGEGSRVSLILPIREGGE